MTDTDLQEIRDSFAKFESLRASDLASRDAENLRHQQELSGLRQELDRLRSMGKVEKTVGGSEAPVVTKALESPNKGTGSRRGFFKAAGTLAAGAVAANVFSAQPAAAADGGSLLLGAINDATNPTELRDVGYSAVNQSFITNPMLRVFDDRTGVRRGGIFTVPVGANNVGLVGQTGTAAGSTPGGIGVVGQTPGSSGGVGVSGRGDIDLQAAGSGRVSLFSHLVAGPPTAGSYSTGEIIRDSGGNFWACVDGTPVGGRWLKMAGAGTSGQLHLYPGGQRYVNTFDGTNITAGPIGPSQSRDCPLWGSVPSGSTAVTGTLTAYPTGAGAGNAAVVFGGSGSLGVTVGWPANSGLFSGSFVVPLNGAGFLTLYSYGQTAHYTIDITGFYR
jgi:hypothetical protein